MTYVAPEILIARPHDHRVDAYSLGAMLYEIVAKTVPFTNPSSDELLEMIVCEKPRLTGKPFNKYSTQLVDLLGRLLKKNPRDRLPVEEVQRHRWLQ